MGMEQRKGDEIGGDEISGYEIRGYIGYKEYLSRNLSYRLL